MGYYYNFPYSKKLNNLVIFSCKLKNKPTVNCGLNLLNIFEMHLVIFLMRCRLFSNLLDSRRAITGGNVLVNGISIYNTRYILKMSDIVQLQDLTAKYVCSKYFTKHKPRR